MSRNLTYGMIRDDYITGAIERTLQTCSHCGERCSCISVTAITLPPGIDSKSPKLIAKRFTMLGLGCGCYARFHRQIAHIQDHMKRAEAG